MSSGELNGEETPAPYKLPSYTRQWVYTFLALAAAFTGYFKIQHSPVSKSSQISAVAPAEQESYWFFVLQLPNPNPDSLPEEIHRKSLDWLNALRREGFQPMLLSDVRARLNKGMLLPEKTLVLTIDEALLTTLEAYQPLLKDFKFPAVLVTSLKPLQDGDRGYLSSNAVEKLPLTGSWDVILTDEHSAPKLLAPQEEPTALPLPPGSSPWSPMNDLSLANQLPDLRRPRRLPINWQWSGQDVVHRFQAETPIHPNGSRLGARQIMDRQWGVVLSKESNPQDRFSLQASPDQRSADIGWLGTRGMNDFQIDFSLDDATGQVWFLLRSAGDRDTSIRVGFYDGKVIAKERVAGVERLLGMTNASLVFPWKGTIQLSGQELRILQKGETILVTRVRNRPLRHAQSMVQLLVYDQLFGAAHVRDISMEILPLLSDDTEGAEGS